MNWTVGSALVAGSTPVVHSAGAGSSSAPPESGGRAASEVAAASGAASAEQVVDDDLHSIADVTTQISEAIGPTFDRTPWHGWAVLLGAVLLGLIASRLARAILEQLAERLRGSGRETAAIAVRCAARPAGLGILTALLAAGLHTLFLGPIAAVVVLRGIALLYIVALAWLLMNLVELIELWLGRLLARGGGGRVHQQFVPLLGKALRLFVLIVFALFVAENIFNANITAWIAGLGIAGLAVSLAAQDSVKNVFGSVTVLMDRPFAVGDRIVFDGIDGTVESIGFRSTKIRSLPGHVITVPNLRFTDGKVENISARGAIRRQFQLELAHANGPEKMAQAAQIVRSILDEEEIAAAIDRVTSPPLVAFDAITPAALILSVSYAYPIAREPTRDPALRGGAPSDNAARDVRAQTLHSEQVNLRILRRFEAAGILFANQVKPAAPGSMPLVPPPGPSAPARPAAGGSP